MEPRLMRYGFAALLTIAPMAATHAQSRAASPAPATRAGEQAAPKPPDIDVIPGIKVFNREGVTLGRVEKVVRTGGEPEVILSVGTVTGHPERLVAVPYSRFKVENGVVRYDTTWERLVAMKAYHPRRSPPAGHGESVSKLP